jgi:hypothetical protein
MKKITNAMSGISDVYIDELKSVGVPIVRRRSFKTILIAATLTLLVVCVSLFAVIGSKPPEPSIVPIDISETTSQNSSGIYSENVENTSKVISDTDEVSNETSVPVKDISTNETSNPNNTSSSVETSQPDENSNNESSWNPPHIDENGASFTAQQIADIFDTKEDGGTNKYQVFGFESVNDIKTGSIPQGDLPMILESAWEYDYHKYALGGVAEYSLYLDGKTIILPEDVSYEEVYSIALEWLPHCQKYFGFKYDDIEIINTSNGYKIIYYDSSQSYPYFYYGRPIMHTNAFLELYVCTNTDSGIITLSWIEYKSKNNTFAEGERFNTISLEEAKAMLEKGYVFGGHSCPLCMQEQETVDFSDYDHVGIEYVQKATYEGYTNEYYPFYAFYKEIEDGRFARTYVPAFRVSGLEEYFESQKSKHNSSGLIPV